ncbi:MAG: Tat pathway signal protein [Treponema sp. GWB1_62_6]|nr:MAG: Tat pathway signal protein [Treponema sp. GWA1_62_8]OHE68371.1 MAG: Tat pathway signal protein [Treponema sp. GWC1_61_84]OHE71261.1 MAG: Tat pathway signal protein [Treponema sp. RIFOXYC1_FULL_61_9]OHE71719.1 MAG: Tat pathway signal protein [Treponema sp. GWB1_62_6]HCM28773.1 Tat pathway signal protein [Treponema sp.]
MDQFFGAFLPLFQPLPLLLLVSCSFAGIIFGAIPGLSGGMGVSLLLPLTFGTDPLLGFAAMIGMWVGGVSGGFIAAVLIGIPGTPSSIATCFDGYPMSRNGETVKALSIGIVASFIGTLASTIIAVILSPVIARFAVKLGPWEYFSLCFCAMMLVSSLSGRNIFKGMAGALFGLLLSMVGTSVMDGVHRFTLGTQYLKSGVDMVTMMLGMFAFHQIAMDYAGGTQALPKVDAKIKGFGLKLKDVTSNIGVIVRTFLIGLWIGFLPGMGAGISNILAYGHAKSTSGNPENFGKGEPAGVWASEVSNNASVGGAVIPMISLGIPGDGVTALLLVGLMVHGLQPGPLFLMSNPETAYMIFAAIIVSAFIVLAMQTFGIRWFPKLLGVPYHYLFSAILILCFIGAFTSANNIVSIFAAILFGMIGILLDYFDIPMGPMVLSFILGSKIEEYLRKGISYTDEGISAFVTRPVSLLFLLLGVASFVWPLIKNKLARSGGSKFNAEKT